MAISSIGYANTLTGPVLGAGWAHMIAEAGGVPGAVLEPGALRASIGQGDRAVQIAAGPAAGWGVTDLVEDAETVNLAAGNRWDLIALRRDWAVGSSIVVIPGSTAKQLPLVGDGEGQRRATPGVVFDQPLALARVQTGSSQVLELVDLRVWQGPGGAYANDELVLSFLNSIGTQVQIGPNLWTRTLDSLGSPKWHREDRTEDTGWVDISRNSGWNFGFGQVRRIGGVVYYRISPSRVQWNAGANIGTVPAGFRPSAPHFAASTHPSSRGQAVQIAASGSITAPQASDGASGLTINGSYPAS